MQYTHSTIDNCRFGEIKKLLEKSNYFKYCSRPSCSCKSRYPIYNPEWDYEHREFFSIYSQGATEATKFLSHVISLDLRRGVRPSFQIIKDRLKGIPIRHRKKIADIIKDGFSSGIPPYVKRVSITGHRGYLGWIDLGPFGDISEAYLRPPYWMKHPKYHVTCERSFYPAPSLRPRTKEVEKVEGVPFVIAGGHVGVCAQYAARLLLLTLEGVNAPTVPELTFGALQNVLMGGVERERKEGLSASEIGNIIEKGKYNIFNYSRKLCPECGQPVREIHCSTCDTGFVVSSASMEPTVENIYAYVESGIPVILGIEKAKMLEWWDGEGEEAHAIVAIGHTLSKNDKVDGLIVHDVSKYPYKILNEMHNGRGLEEIIREAVVPVPLEVTIRYEVAREAVLEIVDLEENEKYRPMLVEADRIKKWLGQGEPRIHFDTYTISNEVKRGFSRAFLDRYVWLFEIKKDLGKSRREYRGDVIISATRPKTLGFNFPTEGIYAITNDKDELVQKTYDID